MDNCRKRSELDQTAVHWWSMKTTLVFGPKTIVGLEVTIIGCAVV